MCLFQSPAVRELERVQTAETPIIYHFSPNQPTPDLHTYLNGNAVILHDDVRTGLQEGVVLNIHRVDENFVAAAVGAVLSRLKQLTILVHVQHMRKHRDALILHGHGDVGRGRRVEITSSNESIFVMR